MKNVIGPKNSDPFQQFKAVEQIKQADSIINRPIDDSFSRAARIISKKLQTPYAK